MTLGKIDLLLDAIDELYCGSCLVELIGMTARHDPNGDQKAIAVGVRAALDRLEAARSLLDMLRGNEVRA